MIELIELEQGIILFSNPAWSHPESRVLNWWLEQGWEDCTSLVAGRMEQLGRVEHNQIQPRNRRLWRNDRIKRQSMNRFAASTHNWTWRFCKWSLMRTIESYRNCTNGLNHPLYSKNSKIKTPAEAIWPLNKKTSEDSGIPAWPLNKNFWPLNKKTSRNWPL